MNHHGSPTWFCASPATLQRTAVLILMLASGTGLGLYAGSPLAGSRPNIIVFLADDQDKPRLSHYNPGAYYTPNFDRLASAGMLFADAHMTSTVCTPSRYSIITGRYAGRSQWPTDNTPGFQRFVSFNCGLATNEYNVGKTLQAAGYRTGWVGKFHLGGEHTDRASWENDGLIYIDPNTDLSNPTARAQATADALHNQAIFESRVRAVGFDYAKAISWENLDAPWDIHNPEWMVKAALDFLEQDNGTQPFFLHFNTTLMHGTRNQWLSSLDQPQVSPDGWLDPPPNVSAWMPPRTTIRQRLAAAGITNSAAQDEALGFLWSDESFGAILNKLEAMGPTVVSNTIVIWTSDNGSIYKASAYDIDGTRMPFVVRWPAGIRAGTVCRELVQTIDLAPTFFEAAGAVVPSAFHLDGLSLLSVFDNHGAAPPGWRSSLLIEIGETRAVRTADNWKYVAFRPRTNMVSDALAALKNNNTNRLLDRLGYIHRKLDARAQGDHPEYFGYDLLYNLNSDPVEINNLANRPEHQPRLTQMKALLTGYLNSYTNCPFGEFIAGGDAADPGPPPGVLSNAFVRAQQVLYGTNYNPMADLDGNGLSDLWQTNLPAGGSGATWHTDLDHDGNWDLLEMSFGTNPLLPDQPFMLRRINDQPVLEHLQLFEGGGPGQSVLESSDLASWNPAQGESIMLSEPKLYGLRYKGLRVWPPPRDRDFFRAQTVSP